MNHHHELSAVVWVCAKDEFEFAGGVVRKGDPGRKNSMETLKYVLFMENSR